MDKRKEECVTKICVQTGGIIRFWGYEEGYRLIKEAGFDAVDWNINSEWNGTEIKQKILSHCIFEDPLEEIEAHFAEELAVIRKYGLEIEQAHAPFPAYVKDFPEFNDYAIGVVKQCIRFCDSAGIRYLVVHGISLILDDKTQTPESIREMNLHLYESLIPVLRETNVVVCLENLFSRYAGNLIEGVCSVPEEAVWYIDHLNEKAGKECFGLCLDTGHLNLLGKNQVTYIKKLGKRIKCLHLHDNRGVDDEHLAPYTGTIIWRDVMKALGEAGYEGALSFETFRQVRPDRVDMEAVPAWLKLIHDLGQLFGSWVEQEYESH